MKKIILIVTISLSILSCKKNITTPNSGIFRGVFEMTGLNGGGFETGNCSLAMYEEVGRYAINVDTSETVPYASGGTYIINDATKITFSSNTIPPLNSNPHIFLDSIYTYSFDDNVFELTKVIDTIKYEYRFFRY